MSRSPCRRCDGVGLTGERDQWGFGKPCPGCDGTGEMSASMARSVDRASQREWNWSNPICPICDEQHPPDECTR